MRSPVLPISLEEGKRYYRDFDSFDVIFITGDPYYDHPLSGMAIISRLLDAKGYKVGIIAQPETDEDYQICGRPKYFFCITSGLLDSMLANYTPMLKKRENILVPERALMVYTQKAKQLFPGMMTVLGGVEATIRRFTHFDYKENKLRRGILNDTKADILLFMNAERSILTLLKKMEAAIKSQEEGKPTVAETDRGTPPSGWTSSSRACLDQPCWAWSVGRIPSPAMEVGKKESQARKRILPSNPFDQLKPHLDLLSLDGVAFRIKKDDIPKKTRILPSYEDCVADKLKFNTLTRMHYLLPHDAFAEPCGLGWIMHNRPSHTLREEEMDLIYEFPYTRQLHPQSKNLTFNTNMVEKLEDSVIIGRGCWGSCNFCVIPLVQGKEVAKRSKESIVREIESLYAKGVKKINDLTLPTLNMYGSRCALFTDKEEIFSPVIGKPITVHNKTAYCNQQCVGCKYRVISDDLIPVLEEVEKLQQKYKGTELELRSALRHDIILDQKTLFRKVMLFIRRLKIAPEHISSSVLDAMNKADPDAFKNFLAEYKKINQEQGTTKNLVPYFVVAHPGSTMESMDELRKFCDDEGLYVNLTQVFTPTPGTASTSMYYTGEHPLTGKKVYVPRSFREKKDQKNVLFAREEEINDENG
ncbi:DUF3362 domain-containing protein [Candidatus Woesearchaeota archaeon]|nr:DUF3362 domain-containing protein [Candidatus Woesearchaeota archaeon]